MGRATAELFALEGAKVVVNYNRSEKDALEIVRQINGASPERAIAIRADVSNEEDVKEMVSEALERFGKIDILVNNAGVLRHATLDKMENSELEEMLGTHVRGTIYCTREASRNMIERKYGKIVNVTSIAAIGTALSGTTGYAATKAGVVTLTKRFAFELGKSGINVNCIAPGPFLTDLPGRLLSDKEKADFAKMTVLNRWAEPNELVGPALLLATDAGSYITGTTLVVDGGFVVS